MSTSLCCAGWPSPDRRQLVKATIEPFIDIAGRAAAGEGQLMTPCAVARNDCCMG
jgi:hypothetical protein